MPSDNLNAMLDFDMQHTANLRSFYDYSFSRYTSEGAESINQFARAGLQHQLYESLSSTIDIHGALSDNTSPGATLDQQSAGTAGSVDYSKLLGEWGHLSIGDSASYDLTHQTSTGSQLSHQQRIAHRSGDRNFLSDAAARLERAKRHVFQRLRHRHARAGRGARRRLRRDHHDRSVADPDLQHRPEPHEFEQLAGRAGELHRAAEPVRKLLGVQRPDPGPPRFLASTAPEFMRVTISATTRPARPGSSLKTFPSFRPAAMFRGKASAPMPISPTASPRFTIINLWPCPKATRCAPRRTRPPALICASNGALIRTPARTRRPDLTYYSFTAHCDWQPVSSLSWNSEVGYELQRGAGENQNLIVARSYLNWFVGKLDFRLGYEFQNQEYTSETRERNYVFLRMRRNF